jgi:hypothetical protein
MTRMGKTLFALISLCTAVGAGLVLMPTTREAKEPRLTALQIAELQPAAKPAATSRTVTPPSPPEDEEGDAGLQPEIVEDGEGS